MNLRWLPTARSYRFMQALPWRSRLIVLAGVFFTFGSIGFVQHMVQLPDTTSWPYVAVVVGYTGALAAGVVLAVSVRRWLVPIVIVLGVVGAQVGLPALHGVLAHAAAPAAALTLEAARARLQVEGLGCLVFIMLGYLCFIRFIRTEGARQLRLQAEIALAERIHETLVPVIAVTTGPLEIYGRSSPSSEVGGDLLDCVRRGDNTTVCIADVAGHGVSAGTFMGMTKSAIRMKLLATDALDALLVDLNEVVCQLRSPGMFVTFAGIRFDGSGSAEVALAGHLPVLHWRAAAGTFDTIENRHPPLGVVEHQTFATRRVAYDRGDLFVLVTDGITEVADAARREFSLSRVQELVGRLAQRSLAEIHDTLIAAARKHGRQTDDQTLVLVRAG